MWVPKKEKRENGKKKRRRTKIKDSKKEGNKG